MGGGSRLVRVTAALAFVTFVAGIAIAATSGHDHLSRQGAQSPDSLAGAAGAAAKTSPSHTSGTLQPYLTPPLRTLKSAPFKYVPHDRGEDESNPVRIPGSSGVDTVVQRSAAHNLMPSPIQTFDGISNLCGCAPPDTNGDVGPNHYMEWVNLHFAVYRKTGTLLLGPLAGNTLFPASQSVCHSTNNGDPIVLYDQFAQRWLATQLAFQNISTGPYYQCIAVSTTDDPTRTWCTYQAQVHTSNFKDYPKFGIWPSQDTYTMTSPQFLHGSSFAGIGIWGFQRSAMLACQTSHMVYRDMNSIDSTLPRMLPADADGLTAPPANAPEPIVTDDDNGAGFPADRIDVWNATINWSGTPSITVAREGYLNTAPFDQDVGCGGGRTCIPQPGTSVRVDALPNRPMYRLAYRNYGSYQALAYDHTVDADAPSGNRAGMRWYELRKTTGNWAIQNQGTFGPADGLYRWMGAAAMDHDGNLAVGYSIGNGTAPNYPSIA